MNIHQEVERIKTESTIYKTHIGVLKDSLKHIYIPDNGDIFEFGVYHGTSLNNILKFTQDNKIYAFDSFLGLPEAWSGAREHSFPKGHFSTDGSLPNVVNDRVTFIKGFFEDSLPEFLKSYKNNISFIHIDCDIYSSTKTIFNNMKPYIKSGTIILFDELIGYPDFELHEIKAWLEFVQETGIKYKYLYSASEQVSLVVL
jgi:hypothetical protein